MKHRRGPFSEDVRLSQNPDQHERQMLVNQQRDRWDALRVEARRAGMTPAEVERLGTLGLDEAERFLRSWPRGRRVRNLARAERMRATCTAKGCGHRAWVDLDRRRWGHILLREVGDRLVCARCGAKGAKLEIGPGWPRG
ncbi:hypothetical protein AB4Z01_15155 [Inquilinus sp. YAF38]|uniref:hypothetical protein n=1 Tax=Inquilinus sp. YAF38 TaxID=3233084 RepID=UPI003F91A7B3